MNLEGDIFDAVIVGGGPAGLSAALLLARCCKRVVVIDAGQPRNASARLMHGFLGRDGTPPRDLLAEGRRELKEYGVEVLNDTVSCAQPVPADQQSESARGSCKTLFRIETEAKRMFLGRKILLATGMRDELPPIPGVAECYGVHVHHCPYCDGYEHRGKKLLAFGFAAEAAVGLALALRGWSRHVTALSHGDPLTPQLLHKAAQAGIEARAERVVRLLHNSEGLLHGVALDGGAVLAADAFFFNTPQRPGSDLARSLGCEFEESVLVKTTARKKATCIPGLFLAGDVDGDVQSVIVAAAEGATAAAAINRELQEDMGWV